MGQDVPARLLSWTCQDTAKAVVQNGDWRLQNTLLEGSSKPLLLFCHAPALQRKKKKKRKEKRTKVLNGATQNQRLTSVVRLPKKPKSRLRRAFLLVDSLHGLKTSDKQLLASLRQNAISHQILLSKVDRIFHPKLGFKQKDDSDKLLKLCEELRPILQPGNLDGPEALGELIGCSGEKTLENGQKLGVDRVRWAILAAVGLGDNSRKITTTGDCERG